MGSEHGPSSNRTEMFLGDAINIATRSVHTRLNKLILLRLPLAIPPRADGPSAYTQGILHIAPLYISFESLWHAALHAHESIPSDSPGNQGSDPSPGPSSPRSFPFRSPSDNSHPSQGPRPSPRIYTILNQLFTPGLLRSSRLRSDLRSLTGWSDPVLQTHLEEAATTGRLGEMVAHIRRSASKQPHVLLAYAWVLYMALFSGGRFIRATLESAGAQGFWTDHRKRAAPVHGPLAFFHFPTPQDGEDLKHEFKQRLADVGSELTEAEREDIVREAICIFESLILVINQLDDVCHTRMEDLNPMDASVLNPRSARFRIRDSVIVTRERSYRAAKRDQLEPEENEVDTKESSTSSTSSSSSSSSESKTGSDSQVTLPSLGRQDPPKLEQRPSCHTVQLASASPRIEKDDPFSRVTGRTRSESSSNFDLELTERLARAMRFDPKLPVPERTPTATKEEEAQKDAGADKVDGSDARKRSDSTITRGIQVASALGLTVAVVVAWARG